MWQRERDRAVNREKRKGERRDRFKYLPISESTLSSAIKEMTLLSVLRQIVLRGDWSREREGVRETERVGQG
jgi:hypothetical protein